MSLLASPDAVAVAAARAAMADAVVRTPLLRLADMPGVWLKPEMLQPHGSFKMRAAFGALALADPAPLAAGVVTASAGNFGQGLAAAAAARGIACHIAVPDDAAGTKIAAMRRLGACLHPMPFADWWTVFASRRLPGVAGHFVHPVADPGVLAGNATIGLEIAADLPGAATVIVPFGGGGLAVGVAAGLRLGGCMARVIAVESAASDQLARALAAGRPVPAERRASFIDGMGGRGVLEEMWPLVEAAVAGVVTVPVTAVADAVRLLFSRHRLVAEGAGAAPLAAALAAPELPRPVVCVLSGGNLDPATLCAIMRDVELSSS